MKRPRILVVDDESVVVLVCQQGLQDDFEILGAHNAVDALELLEAERPEVVVSDIRMPGLSGLDFLERAKHIDPDVPVVFMTAYQDGHDVRRAIRLGAFDLVEKPFSFEALRVAVQHALVYRRGMRQRRRVEDLSRALNERKGLDDLLAYLNDHLAEAAGVRLFSLFLLDSSESFLRLAATNHVPTPEGLEIPVEDVRGPMQRAVSKRTVAFVKPDERATPGPDLDRNVRYFDEGSVTLPLLVRDDLIGVLNLNDRVEGPPAYDETDLAFLSIVAEHLASAVAVRQEAARLALALAEVHHMQQRLIQNEKLAAVTKLVAGVAHELKNPLTSLHLAVVNLRNELERRSIGSEDRLTRFVDSVQVDVDRLIRRVESFLSFARPEQAARAPLDVREVIEQALAQVQPRVQAASGAELVVHCADGLPELVADRRSLSEAIVNLLVNALEAVEGKGRVELRAITQDGHLRLSVKDDGPGIPAEIQHHIFELFFTTKAKGSGIGLAQVHLFCDTHGGRAGFDTGASGTELWMELPTAR